MRVMVMEQTINVDSFRECCPTTKRTCTMAQVSVVSDHKINLKRKG